MVLLGWFAWFAHLCLHYTRWYGLTAIDAYLAYNDSTSLQNAKSLWEMAYPYMVQPEHARIGTHPLRTVQFNSTCNGGKFHIILHASSLLIYHF